MEYEFTVGGTRATFEAGVAEEVAELLDHAFGESEDWENSGRESFGSLAETAWTELRRGAEEILGAGNVEHLSALNARGQGVFLPAHVQRIDLTMTSGKPLCCAALPGLRRELNAIADALGVDPGDEEMERLAASEEGLAPFGPAATRAFARLTLAANQAARKDCPLWMVGDSSNVD